MRLYMYTQLHIYICTHTYKTRYVSFLFYYCYVTWVSRPPEKFGNTKVRMWSKNVAKNVLNVFGKISVHVLQHVLKEWLFQ